MLFSPDTMHFADFRRGKSWRSKLAKRGAKLAYRDMLRTRDLKQTAAAVRRAKGEG